MGDGYVLVSAEKGGVKKKAAPSGLGKLADDLRYCPGFLAPTIRSAICLASPALEVYIPIDHVSHIVAIAAELHDFPA